MVNWSLTRLIRWPERWNLGSYQINVELSPMISSVNSVYSSCKQLFPTGETARGLSTPNLNNDSIFITEDRLSTLQWVTVCCAVDTHETKLKHNKKLGYSFILNKIRQGKMFNPDCCSLGDDGFWQLMENQMIIIQHVIEHILYFYLVIIQLQNMWVSE